MSWEVFHADCLEWMKAQPDNCVDLVFCSPPYEDRRTYSVGFALSGQAYIDWCAERYIESLRICRGLVAWVIEGKTQRYRYSASPILLMAELHRRGVHLRKPPVFHRVGIPGSGGPDWLRNDYEFVVCATSGGKLPWSDNKAMGHPPKWAPGGAMSNRTADGRRKNERDKTATKQARLNKWGHSGDGPTAPARKTDGSRDRSVRPSSAPLEVVRSDNGSYAVPGKANPGNVVHRLYTADEVSHLLSEASNVAHHIVGGGVMGDALCHENEAPFPESLAEFFIRSFCPPGGTVLDPFCGSGTTLAVAKQCGRKAIGVEIRESQVDLTKRRIAAAQFNPSKRCKTA